MIFFFKFTFYLLKINFSQTLYMRHTLNMQDSETLSSLSDEMLRHKNNFLFRNNLFKNLNFLSYKIV